MEEKRTAYKQALIDIAKPGMNLSNDIDNYVFALETRIIELEKVGNAFDEKGLGCEKENHQRLSWLKILYNAANTSDGILAMCEADQSAAAMCFDEVRSLIEELEDAFMIGRIVGGWKVIRDVEEISKHLIERHKRETLVKG